MAIYQITLTKGHCTRVSREDVRFCEIPWHVLSSKGRLYVRHKQLGLLHRIIATQMGHNLEDKVVHHIDGNTLNNERSNLLVCSASEHRAIHEAPRLAAKTRLHDALAERRKYTLAYRDANRRS